MKFLLKAEEMLDALQNGSVTFDKASKFMQSDITQREVARLLKQEQTDMLLSDDIDKLKVLLNLALCIYTYSGSETGISDTDYDRLYALFQKITGKGTFTIDLRYGKKEYHKYPILRGTLHKVYSLGDADIHQKVNDHRETLDQWIKRTEEKILLKSGKRVKLNNEIVYCFPKWDGVSCVFEFKDQESLERALTRGHTDVNTATNITCHFPSISGEIPSAHGLKTEIMVVDAVVPEYSVAMKRRYAQARSVASSIINTNAATDFDQFLVVKKLRYLPSDGSEIEELCSEVFNDPYLRCRLKDRESILRFSEEHRTINGLDCDGVVIRLTNPELIQVLGRENDRNNYEVAYKFTEVSDYSKVVDIKFQMGLFGRLTPVVEFEPVQLKGNTITNASLGSMARFRALNLSKGDTIKVLYDIVPYITIDDRCKISGNHSIPEPRYCPDCHSLLHSEGDIVSCQNKRCSWVMKGKIINYIEKMRIPDISFATVIRLYDERLLLTISDLYELKNHREELIQLEGFGKRSVDRILENIALSTKIRIRPSVLLGSIGIEGASIKTFERVFQFYKLDDVLHFTKKKQYAYLMTIEGIGEKKAKHILSGLWENLDLIEFLLDQLDVLSDETFVPKFSTCFTKVRDLELEDMIATQQGVVTDNVTKQTDFLIVPTIDVVSESTKKADKYGIPKIPIDDAVAYIAKHW